MKKIPLVLAVSLICAGSVMADAGNRMAISTQQFAGACKDQSSPESQIYCDVYDQGVYDGYLVTRHPNNAPDFICVVQPAPRRRVVMNQFVDWIKVNPQYDSTPAADTLLRFFAV